jgi:homoserine kinase type II
VVQAQHELIEHLRQCGFPAPAIVPTARGDTFLLLEGELYEVAEYIAGEPYNHERPEHLDAAARMLGTYHACVAGFAPRALQERGDLYSSAHSRVFLTALREGWQLDLDPILARIARQLEARADDLAARFAGHGALPYLIVHGDYYAGNLLFDGDRIVGVVDYDKASWQPRIAELGEALIYFASPRLGHLKHLVYPGYLEREPFARFMQGYAQAVVLGGAEIQALPDYICCIWFSVSLRRLLEQNPQRPAGAAGALREVLALTDWASSNAGEMIKIARVAMSKEHT